MILVPYIIGYLVIAWVVAKISISFNKDSYKSDDENKENAVMIGAMWIIAIPLGAVFIIVGSIVYLIIESGKKLL